MGEKDLKQAAEIIRRNQTFLLACHARPDGDTLGSALALANTLRRMDKTALVLSVDGVPDTYTFLPGSEDVVTNTDRRDFDVSIVPDCDGIDRVGDVIDIVQSSRAIISIDHHSGLFPFGDVQLYDQKAAATAEIVLELIDHLGVAPDVDTAFCLMTAIISDTGAFRFPNVTPRTFLAAARLTAVGVSPSQIARLVYENRSFEATRLFGIALASLAADEKGEIVWSSLYREDFRNAGASDAETEGIINHILAVKGAKVALLFRETPESVTLVSLRSKDSIDVSKVAQAFGGGGHVAAAGCTVDMPIPEAERLVIQEVRKWMAS
jgi:bifunctional oligoribonuclease and PAP phosphatase NrnA